MSFDLLPTLSLQIYPLLDPRYKNPIESWHHVGTLFFVRTIPYDWGYYFKKSAVWRILGIIVEITTLSNYNKLNMDKAKIAGTSPLPVNLEEGKSYAWCTCGLSANQPLCDGSHKPTSFRPQMMVATETKTAYLCTCKQTANPGFCDGAHKKL